jgi:hypothetical protein
VPDNPIIDLIREAAMRHGVDPAILVRKAQIESNLNPNARNPHSSAKGLFQFLDGTWDRYGSGSPLDPRANADAGARFARDNQSTLQREGLPVTPGSMYLAHFAGPKGAVNLLKASPDQPVVSVMGRKAVEANPFLRGMTVADVQNWAAKKMALPGEMNTMMASAAPAGGAPTRVTVNARPTEGGAAAGAPLPAALAGAAAKTEGGLDKTGMQLLMAALQPNQSQQMEAPPPMIAPTPPSIAAARKLAQAIAEKAIRDALGQAA